MTKSKDKKTFNNQLKREDPQPMELNQAFVIQSISQTNLHGPKVWRDKKEVQKKYSFRLPA